MSQQHQNTLQQQLLHQQGAKQSAPYQPSQLTNSQYPQRQYLLQQQYYQQQLLNQQQPPLLYSQNTTAVQEHPQVRIKSSAVRQEERELAKGKQQWESHLQPSIYQQYNNQPPSQQKQQYPATQQTHLRTPHHKQWQHLQQYGQNLVEWRSTIAPDSDMSIMQQQLSHPASTPAVTADSIHTESQSVTTCQPSLPANQHYSQGVHMTHSHHANKPYTVPSPKTLTSRLVAATSGSMSAARHSVTHSATVNPGPASQWVVSDTTSDGLETQISKGIKSDDPSDSMASNHLGLDPCSSIDSVYRSDKVGTFRMNTNGGSSDNNMISVTTQQQPSAAQIQQMEFQSTMNRRSAVPSAAVNNINNAGNMGMLATPTTLSFSASMGDPSAILATSAPFTSRSASFDKSSMQHPSARYNQNFVTGGARAVPQFAQRLVMHGHPYNQQHNLQQQHTQTIPHAHVNSVSNSDLLSNANGGAMGQINSLKHKLSQAQHTQHDQSGQSGQYNQHHQHSQQLQSYYNPYTAYSSQLSQQSTPYNHSLDSFLHATDLLRVPTNSPIRDSNPSSRVNSANPTPELPHQMPAHLPNTSQSVSMNLQLAQQNIFTLAQPSRSPSPLLGNASGKNGAVTTSKATIKPHPTSVHIMHAHTKGLDPLSNPSSAASSATQHSDTPLSMRGTFIHNPTGIQMNMHSQLHMAGDPALSFDRHHSRSSTPNFTVSRESSPASRSTDLVSVHSARTDSYPYMDMYQQSVASGVAVRRDSHSTASTPNTGSMTAQFQVLGHGHLAAQQQYYQHPSLYLNQLQTKSTNKPGTYDSPALNNVSLPHGQIGPDGLCIGGTPLSSDPQAATDSKTGPQCWPTNGFQYNLSTDMEVDLNLSEENNTQLNIARLDNAGNAALQVGALHNLLNTHINMNQSQKAQKNPLNSSYPSQEIQGLQDSNAADGHISQMMGSLEFNSAATSPAIGLSNNHPDQQLTDSVNFSRPTLDGSGSASNFYGAVGFLSQESDQDLQSFPLQQHDLNSSTFSLNRAANLEESRTSSGSTFLIAKPFKCHYSCNKSYKNANGLKYHLIHVHGEYPASSGIHTPHNGGGGSLNNSGNDGSRRGRGSNTPASATSGDLSRTGTPTPNAGFPSSGPTSNVTFIHPSHRQYQCPISPLCIKTYKSVGGLRYHLKHAHSDLSLVDWQQVITYARELAERGSTQLRLNITTGLGLGSNSGTVALSDCIPNSTALNANHLELCADQLSRSAPPPQTGADVAGMLNSSPPIPMQTPLVPPQLNSSNQQYQQQTNKSTLNKSSDSYDYYHQ
ncbi:Transcriptional regulator of ribosomal biogenesis proteins [Batrachochytrium dendrobatidis]|nr:Transcriptional regulator of ribosomal biogenesis proteins [Batrachochytrium dendrobatidis]KAK5673603.1 Transcriptional regulator of ribosomal biogenesis proteins [Batrachochytrium dendrobatidis]